MEILRVLAGFGTALAVMGGALVYMFISGGLLTIRDYTSSRIATVLIFLAKIVELSVIAFILFSVISFEIIWLGVGVSVILAGLYLFVSGWSALEIDKGCNAEFLAALKAIEFFAIINVIPMLF